MKKERRNDTGRKRRPLPREAFSLKGWDNEDVLISHAAVLHFECNLPKQDVAKKLGVSPSKVTALLAKASKRGFVEITTYLPKNQILAGRLLELFSPAVKAPRAIVVVRPPEGKELLWVGLAGSRELELVLRDNATVTIDGGHTIAQMIEALRPKLFENIKLFPVAGGLTHNPRSSPDAIVGMFFGKYGASSGMQPNFFPPLFDYSGEKTNRESDAKKLIAQASKADIFVLGIGVPDPESTLSKIMSDMEMSREFMEQSGVIGIYGYTGIDAEGQSVAWKLDKALFKVPGSEFRKAAQEEGRHVVLIGRGEAKARGIRVLLEGGWCNCLVTDEDTAKAILANGESAGGTRLNDRGG